MPIHYRCPHCGTQGAADEQYAGQSGPCAHCGQTLTMPAAGQPAMSGGPPPSSGSSGGKIAMIIGVVAAVGLVGICVLGILIALLLPAIQAAREAARRNNCSANIKQVALAMHNYHDTYDSFPPAYTVDDNGQPLHSWRVLLLPFLEETGLYDQIAHDEPWDSPANRQFHDRVMYFYTCASSSGDPTETNFVVVVGDQTLFPPDGQTRTFGDVTDGMSNTIMIMETTHSGVNWMEPTDLRFDQMRFTPNGGPDEASSEHPGLVNTGFADGSVRPVSNDVDPQVLRGLLTIDGGEMVSGW
ncbi:MAG: DUF1559 domain-containing protein [Pirellulales bacterium]